MWWNVRRALLPEWVGSQELLNPPCTVDPAIETRAGIASQQSRPNHQFA
jgi:hypothetical protein